MRKVDDGLEVKPLKKGEIQLVAVSRTAEIVFYHAIVAWWYKVRHGFSIVYSAVHQQTKKLSCRRHFMLYHSNISKATTLLKCLIAKEV
jgi:hypothetical protein